MSGFRCFNPNCPRRQRHQFKTKRGLLQHLSKVPQCMEFQNKLASRNDNSQPAAKRQRKADTSRIVPEFLDADLERERQNPFYPYIIEGEDDDNFNQDGWDDEIDETEEVASPNDETAGLPETETYQQPLQQPQKSFTMEQRYMVQLIKLLDSFGAPDYAVEQIIEWAATAHQAGWDFCPKTKARKGNIKWMYSMIKNANHFLPKVRVVEHDCGPPFECITYDFVPQLLSLLQDRDLMCKENLVLNWDDPCAKYTSPDGRIGECHTGSVYQDLYDRVVHQPNQFLCPIIMYLDKSNVDKYSRFTLEPVTFTTSIFTEATRRYNDAWRPMGYLHEILTSSAHKKAVYKDGDRVRLYHKQLDIVMETFATCEQRLKGIDLPIGPNGSIKVDIICPLMFVITDNEEADKLAGRFESHTSGVQRRCRSCDVKNDELDNPDVICQRYDWEFLDKVAQSDDKELRQRYSQKQVDNAFNRIHMALPLYGIVGSTPPDNVHVVGQGQAPLFMKQIRTNMPPKACAEFDQMAIRFHKSHRQSARKLFPTTDFSRGITNLTQLTANEQIGVIFVFVIVSHFQDGWEILQTACNKNSETANVRDVVEVMEAFLCFHAWLKLDKMWPIDEAEWYMDAAQTSIRELMRMFINRLPREKGEGWNLLKTHLLLHFVDEIAKFGVPKNFDTERPEHNHLHNVKHPGRRAQKSHESFERSVAQRVADTFIINAIDKEINGGPKKAPTALVAAL